jgi:HD-like signal output (HDOD) protein/nitrogen-specific signal transduction histidine kinase
MQADSLDIHQRLATARLPALPQVLLELMALCDRDDVGMAEIGEVVAKDAGVAARVIGIANSPCYRPGRALESIGQCLAVLGTTTVRRLALNQSVAELFGRFHKPGDHDPRHFWFRGLTVAVTARELAVKLGYRNPDEAYLAGLLHDVGQLALLSAVPDRYLPILRNHGGEHERLRQEQAAFGLTHAEAGAWLAERWNLHAIFVDSIRYHHESMERAREAHPLVQIVLLANLFNAPSQAEFNVAEADLAFWHMDIPQALALLETAQNEARAIAAELGIDPPPRSELPVAADQGAEAALAEAVSQRLEGMLAEPEAGETEARDDAMLDLLRGATILFGARGSALFLPVGDALCWRGVNGGDERGAEIRIDPASAQSRIALAYRGRIGLAGHAPQTDNLADAQVLRILGGDRLLCLPLAFEGRALGALAVALDLATVEHFARKQALLLAFAREAGKRMGLAARQDEQIAAARREAAQRHELHARKLVHEAGNPLGVIRNYLSVLRQQVANQDQARADFDLIEEELRRVGRILQQMRQPAPDADAPRAAPATRVNVNALIDETVRFCRLGKQELIGIDLRFSPAADMPPVTTEPDKLKQILTNLVFNAAEAQRGKGSISLATAWWRAGQDRHTLEISVADDGPGLPGDVLESLYQPLQSTKGDGHAGLGLSIVAGLVRELGGSLQCNSGPAGTRFKILLPMSAHAV